jgi:hypothetical protein
VELQLEEDPVRAISEWSLLRLAYFYAQSLDRNDPGLLESLFTPDGVLERPDCPTKNRAEICEIPLMLTKMYVSTLHTVLNQTMEVSGDTAKGETYCIAYHIAAGQSGTTISLNKAIRYQDECERHNRIWRFKRRRMVYVWTEARQVTAGGTGVVD